MIKTKYKLNFPNEWSIIPLYKNTKKPALPSWDQNIKYNIHDFLAMNPNEVYNFGVINGKVSNNLIILDFDLVDKETIDNKTAEKIYKDFYNKFPFANNTKVVRTPHGIHIYFYVEKMPKRTPHHECVLPEIDHIDILGQGGYTVIPPSQLEDGRYIDWAGDDPVLITEEQLNKIINYYSPQEFDKEITTVKPKEKAVKIKKEDMITGIDLYKFRTPFRDILTGKIDIDEYAKKTGKDEFIYWKMLYLEADHAGFKPQQLYPTLRISQPSFEREKTEQQLKHHVDNKKYTMRATTIPEYFPGYSEETFTEDWMMIANWLNDEFEIVTMDDSGSTLVKRGNIYTHVLNKFYKRLAQLINYITSGKSYKHIRSTVITYLKDVTLTSRKIFCYDDDKINFLNGYYDITKQKFIPNDEDDSTIFIYEIPHKYKKGRYDCPEFIKRLKEWLGPDNVVTPDDIFEMIGYTMTMDVGMKKAFFIYGGGNAGKTQFQTVLENIIGEENRGTTPLQRLSKNEFGTAGLEYVLLNMIGDMSSSTVDDVSIFKVITGGDKYIGAEIKGGKKYKYRNITKIWYNANYIPKIAEKYDKAFFIRWILIHFPNVFPETSGDTIRHLGDKICEDPNEVQGIIHRSIEGATRLRERGSFRKELIDNTEHLWKYNSDPIYAFIYDNCILERDYSIEINEFRNELNDYLYNNDRPTLTPYKINRMLETMNIKKEQDQSYEGGGDYYYVGIGWKRDITESGVRRFT